MNKDMTRKPGEVVFALLLSLISFGAVWQAYGIAGFEALSSPGAFPMAVASVMVISSVVIAVKTLRAKPDTTHSFFTDVLPPAAAMMIVFILLYAIALKPLGFLSTSLAFLFVSVLILSRRGLWYSAWVSLVCLAAVYVIFRLVFSVLMPEGIVPEREILAFIAHLFEGTK
ncbi:tripartite tricarboxylate transporter TctB family protein [Celeribacter sp.]|uniref:tripartite tricarboxylate transporter TctB family protein n=1 Tax=Celeribacter sp. TaxID=1890673 RepID=UPI003A9031EA